jgi:hypothetical protein
MPTYGHSRGLSRRAADVEFFHAVLERGPFQSQFLRRSLFARQDPIGSRECLNDVRTFSFCERPRLGGRVLLRGPIHPVHRP